MAERIVRALVTKRYDDEWRGKPVVDLYIQPEDADEAQRFRCWTAQKMAGVEQDEWYDFILSTNRKGEWNIAGLAQDPSNPFEQKADELDRVEGKSKPRQSPPKATGPTPKMVFDQRCTNARTALMQAVKFLKNEDNIIDVATIFVYAHGMFDGLQEMCGIEGE